MGEVATFNTATGHRVQWTSDELLDELGKYAFVDIFNSDDTDTWAAKATMRIKTPGAQFTVHSGHRHASAKAALVKLLELVENAYKEAARHG